MIDRLEVFLLLKASVYMEYPGGQNIATGESTLFGLIRSYDA